MSATLDPDEMPGWLGALFAASRARRSIVAGVNEDDCAVLEWNSRYLVATLDFLNANPIALELGIGGMYDFGRLVVGSNLSDLCGSGALPVALLIGVTMPKSATKQEFKAIMRGVKYEADRYGVAVVGGDSKLGNSMAIMAVAIGSVHSRKNLFLKNAARAGDIIWVSGPIGSAAAAAWGYRRSQLGARWRSWAKRSLLTPSVPLAISLKVSASQLGHGGTDISDGLGAEIQAMCQASGAGAVIDCARIPVAPEVVAAAKTAGVLPWTFAFASGGDFQFIVTSGQVARRQMAGFGLVEIGRVTRRLQTQLRLPGGRLIPLPVKGHRDRRNLPFQEEIDVLINEVMQGKVVSP